MKKNRFIINPQYFKKYEVKEIEMSSIRRLLNDLSPKYFKSTYNYDELQAIRKQLTELEERAKVLKSDPTHFEDRSDRTFTLVLSEIDQLKRKIFDMEEVQKRIIKIINDLLKNPDGCDEK